VLILNIQNKYYDTTDPANPVKTFFDDSIFFPISTLSRVESEISLVRNEYKINSWYSFFFEGVEKHFYSLEKNYNFAWTNLEDSYKAKIIFNGGFRANVYETQMMGIFDVLGAIGGLYELLRIITSVLLVKIINFQMKKDILDDTKEEENSNFFTYPPFIPEEPVIQKENKRKVYQNPEMN